jgi:Glycosyl hydrolases family 15
MQNGEMLHSSIHKITMTNSVVNSNYPRQFSDIFNFLQKKKTFYFPILENGLFPAANLKTESEYTGYSNVWVRDNIHIAHAHYINGDYEIAIKNVTTFADYFIKHQSRFEKIILGEKGFDNPMNRPHIRFNGKTLEEIDEKWSHAQNDALGYFLWFFCKLYNESKFSTLTPQQNQLLALFVLYFDKIEYWQDEDNGHWEEAKKIEASSIGVVVAALTELKTLVQRGNNLIQYKDKIISPMFLNDLIAKGQQSLRQILPAECVQLEKNRPYDAALLFLIFPLNIIQNESLENQILENVIGHLQGDYGIRRYVGDSYWCADYKEKLKQEQRTIDVSEDMASRDSLLVEGQEAQWCIFDPIISVIYGKKYQQTKKNNYLQLQTDYFNRSLAQLTPEESPYGGSKCPELYYLENGKYVPNDTTPLLWTQANLWIAFKFMEESLTTIQ